MRKLCQGPSCHQYDTTDRKRGPKGNKRNITRNVGTYNYGNGNFCSLWCQNNWFDKFGNRAIDHFGRTTVAKHLTEENAWVKDYDWEPDIDNPHRHYYINKITNERRPITEQQYDNEQTITDDGRLAI